MGRPHSNGGPEQILASGRFTRLIRRDGWEYVERTGSSGVVAVLAVTAEGALLLAEQYRPPVLKRVIDLPAGLAGDLAGHEQEVLTEAARRELEEETGFTAESFDFVVSLPSSPGLTAETVELFVAHGVSRCGDGGGDDSENITVHAVDLENIADWLDRKVAAGCLVDPKVFTALWWAERQS